MLIEQSIIFQLLILHNVVYFFPRMYGLILNNFVSYLQHKYGEEAWDSVRRLANIDTPTFSVHKVSKSYLIHYSIDCFMT